MFARCAGLRHVLGRRLTPGQHRCLHLHEYQSKAIMASYGVNVQKGDVADTPDGALQVARRLVTENPNARELVVKAQILAGGRGKGHFDNGFKGANRRLSRWRVYISDPTSDGLQAVSRFVRRRRRSPITPSTCWAPT